MECYCLRLCVADEDWEMRRHLFFLFFAAVRSSVRIYALGFPGGSEVKVSACNGGDLGSIPGLGRSPGEENGNPLQYSCLQNPVDGRAWWAIVHGVAKSQTGLIDLTFTFTLIDIKHFRNGYTLHRLGEKKTKYQWSWWILNLLHDPWFQCLSYFLQKINIFWESSM